MFEPALLPSWPSGASRRGGPAAVADRVGELAAALGDVAVEGWGPGERLAGVDLVDLIGSLARLTSAAEACSARAANELDTVRRAEEAEAGVPVARRGAGVAAEVALARRESGHRGRTALGLGRILCTEMPHTMRRLADGTLTPWRATLLVRESACMEQEDRTGLDEDLCADPRTLAGMGDRSVIGVARRWCAEADPAAVVARRSQLEGRRRVSLRPAPDTMAYLTALLPVAEGVAAYRALVERADRARAEGDPRTRSQVMADALVAGVTGRAEGATPGVLVNLVMTDRSLFHGGREPGELPGYGPVPAATARDLVGRAAEGEAGAFVRRLYAAPRSGALVATDARGRAVPRGLTQLIRLRDGDVCRMPWCDAPARHIDHVMPVREGGMTAAENLQGLCEAHNYAKDALGWRSRGSSASPDVAKGGRGAHRHLVSVETPSGHRYRGLAPPLPGTSGTTRPRASPVTGSTDALVSTSAPELPTTASTSRRIPPVEVDAGSPLEHVIDRLLRRTG